MIKGAMDELRVGDPKMLSTDVGPIISPDAAKFLQAHIDEIRENGGLLHSSDLTAECENGMFVAPALLEIEGIGDLTKEHFGPIVHVVRFAASDFDQVLHDIASTGYGLTFGIHTRIESRIRRAARMARVGNAYANRNTTGAVVGSQPFGGRGLSGTGPKAGGPK